jgi:membrane-bound lytic murein transglycosylase F
MVKFIVLCVLIQTVVVHAALARSLEEIRKTKEIRFCLAGSGKDFYQKNAQAFADYLGNGIQPEFIRFEAWNEQFLNRDGVFVEEGEYTPEPLESCRCDLYPNDLVKLEWREKKLAFVSLFLSRNTIIVNRADTRKYLTVKDLAGKTAGVMNGTSFHTWLEDQNKGVLKNNPAKIVFMPQKEAILAVDKGTVDFAISGADGALWAIKNFSTHAKIAFPVGETTEYGWCFRKEDKDLQSATADFFDSQKNDPDSQLNKNWKEYIGLSIGEFILFVTSSKLPQDR